MKKCSGDLKYLGTCSPKTRKLLLKGANSDLIKDIAEAAWTVLSGEVKLTPAQRKRLVKDKSILCAVQFFATPSPPPSTLSRPPRQ